MPYTCTCIHYARRSRVRICACLKSSTLQKAITPVLATDFYTRHHTHARSRSHTQPCPGYRYRNCNCRTHTEKLASPYAGVHISGSRDASQNLQGRHRLAASACPYGWFPTHACLCPIGHSLVQGAMCEPPAPICASDFDCVGTTVKRAVHMKTPLKTYFKTPRMTIATHVTGNSHPNSHPTHDYCHVTAQLLTSRISFPVIRQSCAKRVRWLSAAAHNPMTSSTIGHITLGSTPLLVFLCGIHAFQLLLATSCPVSQRVCALVRYAGIDAAGREEALHVRLVGALHLPSTAEEFGNMEKKSGKPWRKNQGSRGFPSARLRNRSVGALYLACARARAPRARAGVLLRTHSSPRSGVYIVTTNNGWTGESAQGPAPAPIGVRGNQGRGVRRTVAGAGSCARANNKPALRRRSRSARGPAELTCC